MPKISPKVCRVRRRTFTSLVCKIVRYYRRYNGTPDHEVIHAFATVRSNELGSATVTRNFWFAVEHELQRLRSSRGLSQADAKRIRDTFARVIPKPAPVAGRLDQETIGDLKDRYPALRKA